MDKGNAATRNGFLGMLVSMSVAGSAFCQSAPVSLETDAPVILDAVVLQRWDVDLSLYVSLPTDRKSVVASLVRSLERTRRRQVGEIKILAGDFWKQYVDEREKPTPTGLALLNSQARESAQVNAAKAVNHNFNAAIPDVASFAHGGGVVFDGSNAKKTASFILPSAVAAVNITAGVEFIRAQRVVDRTFSWSGKADSALHTANIGPALTAVGGVLAVTDGVWNIVSSVILARKTHKSGFNERTIIGGVKIGGGTLQLISLAVMAAAPYLLAAGSILYAGAVIYQYRHEIAAFVKKLCKKIKDILNSEKKESTTPPARPFVKGMQRRKW
ncbi:MAG: hypothetical protein AAB268_10030 [Elusimicrobiota bacterium]